MSKTIYNMSLVDVIPPNMASDPKIAALCAGLDAGNAFVVNAINNVIVLANIVNQPSDVTDLLALEQQTPYYNQSLPLDVRQTLVARGGFLNAIKGTKSAVEQAVQNAFGSCVVQEWFEYGGQPGYFQVRLNDFPGSSDQIAEIARAIAVTQRASSHLEQISILTVVTNVTKVSDLLTQILRSKTWTWDNFTWGQINW